MTKMLYCFISHRAAIEQDIVNIADMCSLHQLDYIVICGGHPSDEQIGNVVYLNCDDTYEGLSDKVHKMFRYVTSNFPDYSHYCKIDGNTTILSPVDVLSADYYGNVLSPSFCSNRIYHQGKCSSGSLWNNKEYQGEFVDWCAGYGYVLSKKAATIVGNNPPSQEEIYEDLYVGKTLRRNGILPTPLISIKESLYDEIFDKQP